MSELRYLTLDELLKADIRIPKELLGTWLKTHQISMCYAPSGVGKSMFAMSVALAVAGGGEYLGWKADSCSKVLIVDGEMDMYELQERSNLLINSIGSLNIEAAKKNLSFLPFQGQTDDVNWPDLANPEDHDVILKRIKKEKPKLVIFDNLSTLANVEDENSASAWRPCLELLKKIKRLGCTSIIIHHSRKGNVLTSNAYRGSQILSVLLDSIILLEEPEGGPSIGGATFRVNFQKVRGKRLNSPGFTRHPGVSVFAVFRTRWVTASHC